MFNNYCRNFRKILISKPFASKGFEGITTLMPGKFANQECIDFECCGPCPHAPTIALIVIDNDVSEDDLNRHNDIN